MSYNVRMEHYRLWKDYHFLHIQHPDPASSAKADYYHRNSDAIRDHNQRKTHTAAIIIPAYNEGVLLPRTLASINKSLMHSPEPVATIVVDNASTDLTPEIAKIFGAVVVNEPQKGIARARHTGLLATTPDMAHILTTDSDTVVPPTWLSNHLNAINLSGVALTYGGNTLLADFEATLLQESLLSLYQQSVLINRFLKKLIGKPNTPGNNMCFNRALAFEIGGYDIRLGAGEDIDITERLSNLGAIKRIDNPVFISARRILARGIAKHFLERTQTNIKHSVTDQGMKLSSYEDYRT